MDYYGPPKKIEKAKWKKLPSETDFPLCILYTPIQKMAKFIKVKKAKKKTLIYKKFNFENNIQVQLIGAIGK